MAGEKAGAAEYERREKVERGQPLDGKLHLFCAFGDRAWDIADCKRARRPVKLRGEGLRGIIVPMKIVMVGPFGLQPKATMLCRALPLARALAQRGHSVHVLLPPWSAPQDSGRAWEEDGVQVENIRLPTAAIPGLFQAGITVRLVRRALALQPDVIHYFKPKAYSAFTAQLARLRRRLGWLRVRLVLDTDDWEGPGGWNEREPYPGLARWFFAWQERYELRYADAVTVASRALETLAWGCGAAPERTFYLPNGALPPRAATLGAAEVRARHGLDEGPVVLLYTRFAEFALPDLGAIWQRVHAAQPKARLLIVGRGLHGEEKSLPGLWASLGLAEAVRYAGWVQPEELPGYFAAAQAAIYPYEDTLISRCKCSAKLIEMLAHGVPLVASAVGQNSEYIEHGVSGLLAPAGDNAALAAGVVRLLADHELAARLGEGARQRMAGPFSWERLAAVAEEAYVKREL